MEHLDLKQCFLSEALLKIALETRDPALEARNLTPAVYHFRILPYALEESLTNQNVYQIRSCL